MSIFGGLMSGLMDTVGNNRKNNEDDVKTVRSGLDTLNYKTDEDKAESIFTRSMDSAIKMFQKDEGLEQDGWLRPGGPTETRLNRRLEQTKAPEGSPLASTILPKLYDDEIVSLIKKGEGYQNRLYLDTKGNPTIGVGFMIPNVDQAKSYPFYKFNNGKPARKAISNEIEQAYDLIKRQPSGTEHSAASYQSLTSIGLSDQDIHQRLRQKLRSAADELKNKFSDFDKVPRNVQLGLMDMQFNLGDGKLQKRYFDDATKTYKGWPSFFNAYENRDWKKMAVESHRKDIQKERNDDIFKLFDTAK